MDVLCFDLVYFTRPAQFVILSFGVFFFYLLYGYYQELIFSLPGFSGYGWYLTLIQFGYYSVFGKVGLLFLFANQALFVLLIQVEMFLRQEERKVPLKTYTLLALTTVATMGFSNASLGHLNYPTQVTGPVVRVSGSHYHIALHGSASNEGYPKVRNHGEGPY